MKLRISIIFPAAVTAGLLVGLSPVLADDLHDLKPGPGLSESGHATTAEPPAEPEGFRLTGFREPVPKTLAGAKVISTVEAEKLHAEKSALFVDVYPRAPKPANLPANTLWREPPHYTVPGAAWMPNVGYGALPPETEATFKSHLETLTSGDKAKPIVFYCLRNCWMSWNAGKRAVGYGYSNVIWFPEGNDGWQEAGNELAEVKAMP